MSETGDNASSEPSVPPEDAAQSSPISSSSPPSLPYSRQPENSRFSVSTDTDGTTYHMPAIKLPLFNLRLLRSTLYRGRFALLLGSAFVVAAFVFNARMRVPFVTIGLSLASSTLFNYFSTWWYWQTGLTVRVQSREVIVVRQNVWRTKMKVIPRAKIKRVASGGDSGLFLFDRHWQRLATINGPHDKDLGWLVANLSRDLGVPRRSTWNAWRGEVHSIRQAFRRLRLRWGD